MPDSAWTDTHEFLLLIYNDDALVDALPDGRADAMMRDCFATPTSCAPRAA